MPLAHIPDEEGAAAVKQLMRLINLSRPRHARAKRIGVFGALGVIASVVSVAVFALGGAASADSFHSVKFSASGAGASAGWVSGAGSPIQLTVGMPSSTTNALAQLTSGSGKALPAMEPVFNTDNYNAGSPRFYITLSNGDSLEGYPASSGLNGSDMAWAINNGSTYVPWSTITTDEAGTTVKRASVIADGDQSSGTTDMITCLQFNSYKYTTC
jgi:hypothetical protein